MKIVIKDTTATKRAIYESGVNFEQFAEQVGMNVSYLSQVLNRRVSVSIKMARRIAEALDVNQGCIRHRIEGGIVMTLTNAQRQAAKNNDIPLSRVRQRIHQGWDVDKATTTPDQHKERTPGGMKVCGTFITSEQLRIAEETGLNRDMLRHRVYRGMWLLDAITEEKYTPEIKKHYTDADRKTAEKNGLTMDLVYQRGKRGW